jgi:hypothetical protein
MLRSVVDRYPVSFAEGLQVEAHFRHAARAAGYQVRGADPRLDMHRHIDAWLEVDFRWYTVDIKGMKRLQRQGAAQAHYTCVELHGAQAWHRGWLYGQAALIAFETEDSFLLVWRKRLVDFVLFMVSDEVVEQSADAIYKVYSRRDHERITWVETEMLRDPWLLFKEIQKGSARNETDVVAHRDAVANGMRPSR